MATLKTSVPSLVFPYELDNISIKQTDKDNVRVTLEIGGSVVFDNTLYFDKEGFVNIFQVADILRTYTTRDAQAVRILLDGVAAATTTCIPCNIRMDRTAEDFCSNRFLSLGWCVFAPKDGRVYLSFYSDGTTENVKVVNLVNGLEKVVFKQATYNKKGIVSFYLDMKEIYSGERRVLTTTVTAGVREVTIYPLFLENEFPEMVVFENAFNQLETFTFAKVTRKTQPKFETALICGFFRNIRVHREHEYKCFTPSLPRNYWNIFEDLAQSIAVYQYPSMRPVVTTGVDFSKTTDFYEQRRGSITFRDSDGVPFYMVRREPQTFDATFDSTFK